MKRTMLYKVYHHDRLVAGFTLSPRRYKFRKIGARSGYVINEVPDMVIVRTHEGDAVAVLHKLNRRTLLHSDYSIVARRAH